MMIRPTIARPLRRALVGCSVNGELDTLPEPWKTMAEHLAGLTEVARPAAWKAMLAARTDRDELIAAMANVDPQGPSPDPETERLTAHLGDLDGFQSTNRFLWPGWFVRGHFNLLSSDPKIGKTHLMLDLAHRLYFGREWPDNQAATLPSATKTLWVCGDRHQDELRERAAAFGLPLEALLLNASPDEPYGGWNLDDPENVDGLGARVEAEKPGLVVIDTVWRATRRKLSKEDEVNALLNPLITIAQQSGTTLVGLMHLSKDNETLGRRLEGLARAILKLLKPDPSQPTRRRLEVVGNFKEAPPLGVTIREGGCDYDFTPPQEPVTNSGGRPAVKLDKAIAFLQGELANGDQKGCDLIEKWLTLGESKSPIFDAKKRMEAEGRLFVDDSKKPQIWHLVKQQSETV